MQKQPEFRKSKHSGHECMIKFEDGRRLSPYYAVSYNLSEAGGKFPIFYLSSVGIHRTTAVRYKLCHRIVP
jgi:hypothetical protein